MAIWPHTDSNAYGGESDSAALCVPGYRRRLPAASAGRPWSRSSAHLIRSYTVWRRTGARSPPSPAPAALVVAVLRLGMAAHLGRLTEQSRTSLSLGLTGLGLDFPVNLLRGPNARWLPIVAVHPRMWGADSQTLISHRGRRRRQHQRLSRRATRHRSTTGIAWTLPSLS